MTRHSPSASDHLIARLRANALAAVVRQGQSDLDRHLVEVGRPDVDALLAEADWLHIAVSAGDPPPELIDALRSPAGVQRLEHLHVNGRSVHVVINPIGYPAPDRERAVWIQICTLATGSVAA